VWIAIALIGWGGSALAHPETEIPNCSTVSAQFPLRPGQVVRLGDRAYEVELRRLPAPPGEAASTAELLRIDLLARVVDGNGEPRIGSYVPGLSIDYRLANESGEPVATGALTFRLSESGPSYGATVELADGAGPLRLEVDPGEPSDDDESSGERLLCRLEIDVEAESPAGDGHGDDGAGDDGGDGGASSVPDSNLRLIGALAPRGGAYSDIWGWNDGTTFLAIIGNTFGTSFIDVTDPHNPMEVGFVDGPQSSWRDVKTYGDHAYIVTEGAGPGEGLQIVNLSDPQNPRWASTYSTNFTTAHNIYIDTDVGLAFVVGTANGMRILRLQPDPAAPTEVGFWLDRYVHDIYVSDGIAYLAEINNGIQEIADVSRPDDLQILDSFATPDQLTHNCWANDDHSLLVTTDETTGGHLGIYDLIGRSGPERLLGEYVANPVSIIHNSVFDDEDNERVAISHYGLGLKYVDVHRPTMPVELGSFDTYAPGDSGFNGAWGVYPFDPRGYIYVSDIQTGLYVFEYDPSGGTLSGVVRSAADGTEIGGARLRLLDEGVQVVTGTDGIYAAYAQAGDVFVHASAPGFRSMITTVGPMPIDGRVDVDISMVPLPPVGIFGTVRDAGDLSPLEGARITVAATPFEAISSVDGSYLLPQVPAGQQIVTVEAFGRVPREEKLLLQPGPAPPVDFLLEPALVAIDSEGEPSWTLGVAEDNATTGIWEAVDPNGTQEGTVQPESDSTTDLGTKAFITGQSAVGAGVEDNDVDGGTTTLLSPPYDLQGGQALQLRYSRWMSNNAGVFVGGSLRVQASADDGQSWTTLEEVDSNANAWVRRTFDLASFITLTDRVRVRFQADPFFAGPFDVLEAGVDALEIVRVCRAIFNPALTDGDRDGLIDVCDACPNDPGNDADGDGHCGELDNAPFVPNPQQTDGDGDGVGDEGDNCPTQPNPAQRDLDEDGLGNLCDADVDGDGLLDETESDRDGDRVPDAVDTCPTVPDRVQADLDGDGEGDLCDLDDGLITGLRVDRDRIVWEPEAGTDAYNIYRGFLGDERLVPFAECDRSGITVAHTVADEAPGPGDGYFYLVTRIASAQEDPPGRRSDGALRTILNACP
jgi:choice-of-anchor B domain-containing protein